jgi:hypothetical protein
MSKDQWYFRIVVMIITQKYKPCVPVGRKIAHLLWVILTMPIVLVSYIPIFACICGGSDSKSW